MKNKYLIILFSSILLIGCSSVYTVKDFPSKKKFYEDLNNFTEDKNVNVVLVNDSSISYDEGIIILDDTLYSSKKVFKTGFNKILISEIDQINYNYKDNKYVTIITKSSEQMQVEIIKVIRDTMECNVLQTNIIRKNPIPISNIKEVNYNERWIGFIKGFFRGAIIGTGLGFSGIFKVYVHAGLKNEVREYSRPAAMIIGGLSGIVIGSITGWIIGYKYIYRFQ